MLSHRGIIGNMTTYEENIMFSVSVTAAQRRKQYVVTGFFFNGFRKEFFFFLFAPFGFIWLMCACLRMPTVYHVFLSTLYYQ